MKAAQGKQTDFSIVEALIAVVIVGALAATGFFVYQHNQVKVTEVD
jgi:type II secretory pathway pseudopilin PulG